MTDPKTLARTENPQTSKDAAQKMVSTGALSRQENMVYDKIIEFLKHRKLHSHSLDFTTKDIALFMCNNSYHRDYDICRKRFSGLVTKGKIELIYEIIPHPKILNMKLRRPKRRDGCRVFRLL